MITDWDDAYTILAKIPGSAGLPARWEADAAAFRTRHLPETLRHGDHPRHAVDLASMLYSIIATSLAGTLIVTVLVAGLGTAPYIISAAAIGAVAAMPAAWLVARAITARTVRVRA